MTDTTKYSPMLEQYFGMKAKHPEAILLSRVGDFYEAYGEDAETVARALQIALTSKEAGSGRRVAMAGVPHHALSGYLAKLVAQRFIIALAEQLEAPIPNKLVRRDVVRVVTPGTLIEDHLLDGKQNNYLAAMTLHGETFAIAYADVSTGHCSATAIDGENAYDEVLAELGRIGPAEIVADLPAHIRATMATAVEALGARLAAPALGLVETRERAAIDGFAFEESAAIHRALDALAGFVKRTALREGAAGTASAGDVYGRILKHPEFYRRRQFLALDPSTRKHLELTRAQGANPHATLLATLDACETSMGSRMLGRWILAPLVDREAIEARQTAVATLLDEHARRDAMREILRGCFDLERIAQKIRFRRAGPRDLASLRRTLDVLRPLPQVAPAAFAGRLGFVSEFEDVSNDLRATLVEEPPAQLSDGGVIRPEADAELAECVELRTDARKKLSELEERERERSGIKSLKVKYASAFGYAIEVSKAYVNAVPADYVRKQTLTNGERFITPELKELELAISTAQARQERLELRLYEALLDRLGARADDLLAAANAIAEVDVFCALAQCSAERGYVRPHFIEESTVAIEDGRHPVMEAVLHTHVVPNDAHLRAAEHRFILLTGPNMGGKSTYLRQAGLLAIMAQIGSFVPAKSMRLGVVDRIFTRIGAGDDLASGQSTFYMEMAEAANILRRSTRRSLLLIDEVGRGTGTIDGLAIAQAICEFLIALEDQAPMVLFATHFHELCALADHWKVVANYHITAVENTARDGAPVFSHRVAPGSSSRSFGIEVARMAGLPDAVVERAQDIADALSGKADVEEQVPLRRRMNRASVAERQLSFLRVE
ncbi:MAG TPA: DNA mismatch repair protein MutS [Candidatus Baltobacteraceae bacterium]|nr:DNA mismatch repair protein MutS [Candidatus Baltobacteraceae bacterium]